MSSRVSKPGAKPAKAIARVADPVGAANPPETSPPDAGLDVAATGKAETAVQAAFGDLQGIAAFSRENIHAVVRSNAILAKGIEDMGKALMAFAHASIETGAAAGGAMLTVKTLHDVVDLQTAFAKKSLDAWVAEGAKLSEMSMKLAIEAFEPISARLGVAAGAFGRSAA